MITAEANNAYRILTHTRALVTKYAREYLANPTDAGRTLLAQALSAESAAREIFEAVFTPEVEAP